MSDQTKTGPSVFCYAELDWDRPGQGGSPKPPADLVAAAKKSGARRKKLVNGEGGFFMNRSLLPGGFRVPPHSHSHNELIVVLKGGCAFDYGVGQLEADDSIVIRAGFKYGFTCGEDGMEFLTIRTDDASVDLAD